MFKITKISQSSLDNEPAIEIEYKGDMPLFSVPEYDPVYTPEQHDQNIEELKGFAL